MIRAAVFGAAGYGGVELVRLLLDHPEVEVTYIAGHTTAGQTLSGMYPSMLESCDMPIEDTDVDVACERADLLFLALPHLVGVPLTRRALERGKKVIDFSADYRLKDIAQFEHYYAAHTGPELVEQAVYGLPELHREGIIRTQLCAVPGCYPTSAILALAPAAKAGILDPASIIVDSKSGVSGSGRSKLTLGTHFAEINESVSAYNIAGKHRHTPEIEQELSGLGQPVMVSFTPHLIPITRGILTAAYGTLQTDIKPGEIRDLYEDFYADEPFVKVLADGHLPATKHVAGSNFCHLGLAVDKRVNRLIVISVIDNLVKGLSGAAVQCMNLMCGFGETTALMRPAMWP
jgi:N-acetyl-gamma-glutamyl-phosphate reductase